MRNAIGVGKPAVACEAVEHQGKPLIPFDIAWTLEVFIENRADDIAR